MSTQRVKELLHKTWPIGDGELLGLMITVTRRKSLSMSASLCDPEFRQALKVRKALHRARQGTPHYQLSENKMKRRKKKDKKATEDPLEVPDLGHLWSSDLTTTEDATRLKRSILWTTLESPRSESRMLRTRCLSWSCPTCQNASAKINGTLVLDILKRTKGLYLRPWFHCWVESANGWINIQTRCIVFWVFKGVVVIGFM